MGRVCVLAAFTYLAHRTCLRGVRHFAIVDTSFAIVNDVCTLEDLYVAPASKIHRMSGSLAVSGSMSQSIRKR